MNQLNNVNPAKSFKKKLKNFLIKTKIKNMNLLIAVVLTSLSHPEYQDLLLL